MKYNKGFAPIVILIAILLAGAIGGVAYYKGKNSDNKKASYEDINGSTIDGDDYISTVPLSNSNDQDQTPPLQDPKQPNPSPLGTETTNTFFLVDEDSGVNILHPVFTVNGKTFSDTSSFLSYMSGLSSGIYKVDISSSGYKTMTAVKISVPWNLSNMVINLQPLSKAHNCPKDPANKNNFLLCGYVTDESHNEISGVQVASPDFSPLSATTGADGYYEVEFAPTKNNSCGNPVTFTYSKQGYKILSNIFDGPFVEAGGGNGGSVMITTGSGAEQKTIKHGMCP